jgi:hypothetical protein
VDRARRNLVVIKPIAIEATGGEAVHDANMRPARCADRTYGEAANMGWER